MSDRKYRQRGYQDDDRDRAPKPKPNPEDRPPREMRPPNFPGFVPAMRCAQCGRPYSGDGDAVATCAGCGTCRAR